jgi:hypothetical protein
MPSTPEAGLESSPGESTSGSGEFDSSSDSSGSTGIPRSSEREGTNLLEGRTSTGGAANTEDAAFHELDFSPGDVAALQLTDWTLPAWARMTMREFARTFGRYVRDLDVLDPEELAALAHEAAAQLNQLDEQSSASSMAASRRVDNGANDAANGSERSAHAARSNTRLLRVDAALLDDSIDVRAVGDAGSAGGTADGNTDGATVDDPAELRRALALAAAAAQLYMPMLVTQLRRKKRTQEPARLSRVLELLRR